MRLVAFGGGHGLGASLRALRRVQERLGAHITAVVTVGDNGGSSGRLRDQRGALPPGDLRQALAALASDDPRTALTAELFQYRFGSGAEPPPAAGITAAVPAAGPRPGHLPGGLLTGDTRDPDRAPTAPDGQRDGRRDGSVGRADGPTGADPLAGHTVGNLVLCGLMELLGDSVAALDHAAAMVRASGRVLPMSREPVAIEARVRGGDPERPDRVVTVRGQHEVAVSTGRVESVRLDPGRPAACQEAVAEIAAADWLVLGPGSWYTSVIPHLLVPELAEAVMTSPARRLVVLNLTTEPETAGLTVPEHLTALSAHAPELTADVVLGDVNRVTHPEPVRRAAEALGARLVLAPVASPGAEPRHDPAALADALLPVLGAAR